VFGGVACGEDDGDASGDGAGRVAVSEAWARSSPPGVTDGAAYMTIESEADDVLIGAAVAAGVAATAEFHETVVGEPSMDETTTGETAADDMAGHDMAPTDGTGGAMTMQHVSTVDLPAGEPVAFEPGGRHVMLLDLVTPLVAGSSFELTLTFVDAAPETITVGIRDEAP
jgi:copper(I)-binding protein